MPRNIHCNCLCHGADGNVHDPYFSCKNCYAANHMGNLPRQSWEETPKGKGKKEHKGKPAPRPRRPTGTVEATAKAVEVKSGKPVQPQSSN